MFGLEIETFDVNAICWLNALGLLMMVNTSELNNESKLYFAYNLRETVYYLQRVIRTIYSLNPGIRSIFIRNPSVSMISKSAFKNKKATGPHFVKKIQTKLCDL